MSMFVKKLLFNLALGIFQQNPNVGFVFMN